MSFEVGDTCVLQEDVVREFGTIPEGTIVELTDKYRGSLGVHYDAQALACKSCSLIVKLKEVPLGILKDYGEVYSSFGR